MYDVTKLQQKVYKYNKCLVYDYCISHFSHLRLTELLFILERHQAVTYNPRVLIHYSSLFDAFIFLQSIGPC